jgi:hypothetical protein
MKSLWAVVGMAVIVAFAPAAGPALAVTSQTGPSTAPPSIEGTSAYPSFEDATGSLPIYTPGPPASPSPSYELVTPGPARSPSPSPAPTPTPIDTLVRGSVVDSDGLPYIPAHGVRVSLWPEWSVVVPVDVSGTFSVVVQWSGQAATEFYASVDEPVLVPTPIGSSCYYSTDMTGRTVFQLAPDEPVPTVQVVVRLGFDLVCSATERPFSPPPTSTSGGADDDSSGVPLALGLALMVAGLLAFRLACHRRASPI